MEPRTSAVSAPTAVPSGTVAFLFTDIEGSTSRWERFGPAMHDAVGRHDAMLRSLFDARGGYVFKTLGDAFCVAFTTVAAALDAAVEAQRALAACDFSAVGGLGVRIAIHVGTTDERDGDYFGPVVNRVARLLSITHAGQIVLSAAAAALAAGVAGIRLTDLGEHRLKDLTQPERVAQVCVPDLPDEFPSLRSLSVARTNLPIAPTPLVGRGAEVDAVTALLSEHRLVSLLGPGGIGKTRIACQVGAEAVVDFPGGVWFVDLAPIDDAHRAINALAATVGVSEIGRGDLIERIVAAIGDSAMLLIIDNCEHVICGIADAIATLMRACPGVRVLATTRERLHVGGEHLYRVPSLTVPDAPQHITANAALQCAAIELFVARAQAIAPFALTDANAPAVAEICCRLDGIALAIELAAARVKMLSPQQVAQRLDERLRMLTGGCRTAMPRQQTLRALIDWSHDLLDERERLTFRRCGVFAGSFDLNAALAVCADEAIDEWDVVDLLDALADKSLLFVEFAGEERRYRMLESVRAYARDQLARSAELGAVQTRWFTYYRDLVRRCSEAFRTNLNDTTYAALEAESTNLRSVLTYGISEGRALIHGLEIAGWLGSYWQLTGQQPEGFSWLETGLAKAPADADAAVVARAWLAIANLGRAMSLGERALEASTRALAFGESSERLNVVARAHMYAGNALDRLARWDDAAERYALALPLLRSLGDQRGALLCLEGLAVNATMRGAEAEARERYEELRGVLAATNNSQSKAFVCGNLSLLELTFGNLERAVDLALEAIDHARGQSDKLLFAFLHENAAAILIACDRFDEARAAAECGLAIAGERHDPVAHAIAVEHLAVIAGLTGDVERAAILVGYTEESMKKSGFVREAVEQRGYARLLAALGERFDEETIAALRRRGAALDENAAGALVHADVARDLGVLAR